VFFRGCNVRPSPWLIIGRHAIDCNRVTPPSSPNSCSPNGTRGSMQIKLAAD